MLTYCFWQTTVKIPIWSHDEQDEQGALCAKNMQLESKSFVTLAAELLFEGNISLLSTRQIYWAYPLFQSPLATSKILVFLSCCYKYESPFPSAELYLKNCANSTTHHDESWLWKGHVEELIQRAFCAFPEVLTRKYKAKMQQYCAVDSARCNKHSESFQIWHSIISKLNWDSLIRNCYFADNGKLNNSILSCIVFVFLLSFWIHHLSVMHIAYKNNMELSGRN